MDFLDELGSGVMPVSAAEIRDEWRLAYGSTGIALLVVPLAIAILVESPLLVLSDRFSRPRVVTTSLAAMGVFLCVSACATAPWQLALAFGAWATISGITSAHAQGLLMDAHPEDRERWMTRWTLFGYLGDAATPLVILVASSLGVGFRGAMFAAGLLHLGHAALLARVPLDVPAADAPDEDEAERTLVSRLRTALADRTLLAWLAASSLCCLLDEILVVFASLFMRDTLGAGLSMQALAFGACAVSGVIGLVVTERLLVRMDAIRLLVVSCFVCAVSYTTWLFARAFVPSVFILCIASAACAPLYPICAARAYACRPGQPGLVSAVEQLFAWVPVVAPLVVGLVADRFGVVSAMAILLVQPVAIGMYAVSVMRRSR